MALFDFHHHHRENGNGIYNLEYQETPPEHFFSVGIHPKDIEDKSKDIMLQWVYETARRKSCLAIGECGLDSLLPNSNHTQEIFFENQIEIANELAKPIIVHCVRRYPEVIALSKKSKQPLILHGYHKKENIAQELLKHNFYLSFGKAVLDNLSLQKSVAMTPLHQLFLETDDKIFDIELLYHKVASIKKISVDQLIKQIENNLQTIVHE